MTGALLVMASDLATGFQSFNRPNLFVLSLVSRRCWCPASFRHFSQRLSCPSDRVVLVVCHFALPVPVPVAPEQGSSQPDALSFSLLSSWLPITTVLWIVSLRFIGLVLSSWVQDRRSISL